MPITKPIHILMPLAEDQCIDRDVLYGIVHQDVRLKLYISQNNKNNWSFRLSEAEGRNKLKGSVDISSDYTVLLDSDVVLHGSDEISKMVEYLDNHSDVEAVCIDTKSDQSRSSDHIPIACCCVRTKKLMEHTFKRFENGTKIGGCCCFEFNKEIKCEYLEGVKAGEVSRGNNS